MITVVQQRDFDVREAISRSPTAGLPNAEGNMQKWINASEEVWLGLVDGKVACAWGLSSATIISDRAYLWLLTTDLVEEHKFLFIRHSQRIIEEMLKRYSLIIGHVEVGNAQARRWLRWLGADIAPPLAGKSLFVIRRE